MLLLITAGSNVHAQLNSDIKNTLKENPVLIGHESGFTISKDQLKSDPVLRMPEVNKDYHIERYQLSYLPGGKGRDLVGPYTIKGDDMTRGNAADILTKVQPGDRLFFEEIVAVSSDADKAPLTLSASVRIK